MLVLGKNIFTMESTISGLVRTRTTSSYSVRCVYFATAIFTRYHSQADQKHSEKNLTQFFA